MLCEGCGHALEPGARFCGECGHGVAISSDDPTISERPLPGGAISTLDPATNPMVGMSTHQPGGYAPGRDPLVGTTVIGQFVVGPLIGTGGMGRVYSATQPSVGRNAAIKILSPTIGADPERVARFRQEAQAAATLTSPHVVDVYASGLLDDGTPFIAMEWLQGRTLGDVLAGGPIPEARAVHIASSICDVLDEAHRAGVIHRDLKPSNVMLIERGGDPDWVKVLDFGVAKLHDGGLTREGAMFGTPQYMSPEQLRGDGTIDGRADLYSLGLIVYAMVTGRPPFVASTPVAYVHKHLKEAPPSLPPSVSPALAAVIMSALDKDRDRRPVDALAFRAALQQALVAPAGTWGTPGAAEEDERAAWVRWAAALVVLAALGGGAYYLSTTGGDDQSAEPPQSPAAATTGGRSDETGADEPGTAGTSPTSAGSEADADESESGESGVADDAGDRGSEKEDGLIRELWVASGGRMDALIGDASSGKAGEEYSAGLDDDGGSGDAGDDGTHEQTDRPDGGGRRPAGPLSAKAQALLDKDLPTLEKLFRKTIEGALIPPSAQRQALDGYELYKRSTPVGAEHDQRLKTYLVQVLSGYDNPAIIAKKGDRLPLAKLKSVFMSMELKNDVGADIRQQILDNTLSGVEQIQGSPEDKDHYRRTTLAALIRSLAADPEIIDR